MHVQGTQEILNSCNFWNHFVMCCFGKVEIPNVVQCLTRYEID